MALIATSFISVSNNALSAEVPFAIAIHGGAGTIEKSKFTSKEEQAYRAKLTQAVEAGYKVLEQGGESLDAITAAIQVHLELRMLARSY